ncbi:MAG TPA: hypothetical protein GX405_07440 [Rhizobiales bacterium]|nr:hypothetical protein [Hyphomicrobiales bacterium]
MRDLVSIETAHGALTFDAAAGNIPKLRLRWAGRWIEPLHAAPWRDEPEVQADTRLPLVDRRLAGDFFCAPFAGAVDPNVPPHGWTANSAWRVTEQERGLLRAVLGAAAELADLPLTLPSPRSRGEGMLEAEAVPHLPSPRERGEGPGRGMRGDAHVTTVLGATIAKILALAEDAPLLYQEHVIESGNGILPVAHHPMVHLTGTGRFFTSRKRAVLTPDRPLEPGRGRLAYPARSTDLTRVAAADGGTVDLTRWPIGTRNEDFAVLVEAVPEGIGWSAVIREAEDDIVFFLKDPAVLPITMLWFSNGGRDHAPWNGRHVGVVGVEDGCAPGLAGEAAAGQPNPIAAEGVASGLALAEGRRHVVRHVTGAVPRPAGWTGIADISTAGDRLTISDGAGQRLELPWRRDFLKGRD